MACLKLNIPEEKSTALKVAHKSLKDNENSCTGAYRFGFNVMEKDDEIRGTGNSYTTHFRQYDPRVVRWLSVDPEAKNFPGKSPFIAFSNNPILFIDPNGDADFYYNGRFIGSDGVDDNMIGVVKDKELRNDIREAVKSGNSFFVDMKSNNESIVGVNKYVLQVAMEVLDKTIELGGDSEVQTEMTPTSNSFIYSPFSVSEPAKYTKGEVVEGSSVGFQNATVSIHSHPLGFGVLIDEKNFVVHDGNVPSEGFDTKVFKGFDLNVIVGRKDLGENNNFSGTWENPGSITDNRPLGIFLFDSQSESQGEISQDDARSILKHQRKND